MSKAYTPGSQQKVVQKSAVNPNGQTITAQSNIPNQQCVQVSGNQQMQFTAPWLQGTTSFPQLCATSYTLPPQFQNSIFIRPDGAQGMLFHHPQAAHAIQTQTQTNSNAQPITSQAQVIQQTTIQQGNGVATQQAQVIKSHYYYNIRNKYKKY